MKAKTKTKKNVRKFGRHKFDTKDPPIVEIPSCDLSTLRKPIDTSLTSLRHVSKLFETGSEEVKCILAYECEVVYECRICRSLFRSLVNFISHKRIYCPEKFNISMDKSATNPPGMVSNLTFEKTVDLESEENSKVDRLSKTNVAVKDRNKKDLTSIVAMLQRQKNNSEYDEVEENNRRMRIVADTEQVLLEVLESNHAAFQTVLEPKVSHIDNRDLMKAQTTELQNILSRDTAILGPDGCVLELSSDEKCDTPLQFSEESKSILLRTVPNPDLICSICDTKFATKKTLTFHMKSLHTPNRMVYPCPCCDNFFPSTWGVYRHLVKVHRKSNAQVRKLRGEIQAKAYRKETTRAQDIAKDCAVRKLNDLTDSRSATNETQEWMAHLESDGELQRCGGCGKRFDRKAALLAHSQICQRRLAACNDTTIKPKRSKSTPEVAVGTVNPVSILAVGSSVVENDNSSSKENPPPLVSSPLSESPASSSKSSNSSIIHLPNISPSVTITRLPQEPHNEISIRVEDVSSLSKDAWEKIGIDASNVSARGGSNQNDSLTTPPTTALVDSSNSDMSDDPEIIYTKIEKSKNVSANNVNRKRKLAKRDKSIEPPKQNNAVIIPEITNKKFTPKNTTSGATEREHKFSSIANLRKLQCIPCKRKFSSLTYLRRHMAGHINWYRYRCKMCDFKCFDKIDCVQHCNKIHNAKNNRTSIANMILETLPDVNVTNSSRSILKKRIPPRQPLDVDVVDVTKPATVVTDIVNTEKKIECIQNGEMKAANKLEKSNKDDGSYCSLSDDETINETNELMTNTRLDEDPALRRMVMEVIFGSSETITDEKPIITTDQAELRNLNEPCEDQSSSSYSDSDINSCGSTNEVAKTAIVGKRDSRHKRAVRNRTKLEDKDFIYDLDAVLLKEPVEEDLCIVNKNNDIKASKCEHNTGLNAIIHKDDIVENKVEKVA